MFLSKNASFEGYILCTGWMKGRRRRYLEIIVNGSLGFCVGYYWGKCKLVILEKTILFIFITYFGFLRYRCDLAIENLGMPQMLDPVKF